MKRERTNMRARTPMALDSSLIPTQEQDLAELTFTTDAEQTVDLSAITAFMPTILVVRADGDFHEGNDLPVQASNLWRDGGMLHSLAVSQAATWHFMRKSGAG